MVNLTIYKVMKTYVTTQYCTKYVIIHYNICWCLHRATRRRNQGQPINSKHGQHNWDDEYARSYTKDAISEELLRADSTNNATGDAGECKN